MTSARVVHAIFVAQTRSVDTRTVHRSGTDTGKAKHHDTRDEVIGKILADRKLSQLQKDELIGVLEGP